MKKIVSHLDFRRRISGLFRYFEEHPRKVEQFYSFEDALSKCQSGYESAKLSRVIVEKTRIMRDSYLNCPPTLDAQSLRTIALVGLTGLNKEVEILDFGGGAGIHYFAAKTISKESKKFRWAVVETRSLAQASSGLETKELKFFDALGDAVMFFKKVPSAVFANSSLQYLPDPIGTLRSLLRVGAERVFVTRTGFSADDSQYIFKQKSLLSENGPGPLPSGVEDVFIEYPVVFVPIKEIVDVVHTEGYRICVLIEEEKDVWNFAGHSFHQYGLILEKL